MTGRASVFTGQEWEGATQLLRGESDSASTDGHAVDETGVRDTASGPGSQSIRDPSDGPTADRCSPDPCRHTDRYRLVTPFSLRL